MKIYVKLGLNSEYHGYDIYQGVFKSIDEAIDDAKFKYAALGERLGYVTHTHKHKDEGDVEHTHVVIFNNEYGTISEEELVYALENYDEDDFFEYEYMVINCFVLEEALV